MRALFFQHRHHTRSATQRNTTDLACCWLLLRLYCGLLNKSQSKLSKIQFLFVFPSVVDSKGIYTTPNHTKKQFTTNLSTSLSPHFSLHRYEDVVQHYMHFFNLYLTVVFGWYMVGRPTVTRCLWLIYSTDKGKHVKRNKRRNMQQVAAREFMLKTKTTDDNDKRTVLFCCN